MLLREAMRGAHVVAPEADETWHAAPKICLNSWGNRYWPTMPTQMFCWPACSVTT